MATLTEPDPLLFPAQGTRAAVMIAFIMALANRINESPRGSVEFHFEGGSLKPSLHEHFGPLHVQ